MEPETAARLDDDKLRGALNQLPEPYQTILQLRYIQELDYPEIAKITHKTENNLRVMVKRGLDKLRVTLGDYETF